MNLKTIRQLHLYLGTLFAPLIIFFAFSGALQTFRLHEAAKGSSYHPPAWIVAMASVHKDEELPRPARDEPAPAKPASAAPALAASTTVGPGSNAPAHDASAKSAPAKAAAPKGGGHHPSFWLQCTIALMAVGLITTTLLGILMAFRYNRDKRVVWALLIAGALLPLVLLFLNG